MKCKLEGTRLSAEREVQEEYDLIAVVSELECLEIDLTRLQARKSHLQEILEEAGKLGYSSKKEEGTILEEPQGEEKAQVP